MILKSIRNKDVPESVQDSIPYKEMYKDGVCKLTDTSYSKTVAFGDTNYRLAKEDTRDAIFDKWCKFYNYFDSSVRLQISLISRYENPAEYAKSI
ncbi:MAG: conjugal transfer protein TraE, partial [Lachnospiraceae bacterium]|nr:conjugal transfer protein TraE [Lachnospiraceae bacterium]